MKSAWTVTCYIRSRLTSNSEWLPMMELTLVFFGDEPPEKEVVLNRVKRHVHSCVPVMSEIEFTPVPYDILPDL